MKTGNIISIYCTASVAMTMAFAICTSNRFGLWTELCLVVVVHKTICTLYHFNETLFIDIRAWCEQIENFYTLL